MPKSKRFFAFLTSVLGKTRPLKKLIEQEYRTQDERFSSGLQTFFTVLLYSAYWPQHKLHP